MIDIFGMPLPALFSQLLLGLVNGSFYALLSLGLAIIFGMLHIINFAHGAMYMMGAMLAWLMLEGLGVGYWWALLLAPIAVGAFGIVIERLLIQRIARLDPLYGLLLTFGLALVIGGVFRSLFGVGGQPYSIPAELTGVFDLGFMMLPKYRAWVIGSSLAVCFAAWFVIEKTRLGAFLRAATENPALTQALGINVPIMVMLTFGIGVAIAAFAGVLAAPTAQVSPLMSSNIIVVFAVVVIGGMGSILGAICTGLMLGLLEGLTKVFLPEMTSIVVFVVMVIVLIVRPAGLFGRSK